MAKRPAPLKVFATRIGFYEAVVAVSSQKAALTAWDVKANLFAKGLAAETRERAAVEAALGAPGQVMVRQAGTKAAYEPFGPPKPRKRK